MSEIDFRWYSADKVADIRLQSAQYQSHQKDQVWRELEAISFLEIRKVILGFEKVAYMHPHIMSPIIKFYFRTQKLINGPVNLSKCMALHSMQQNVRDSFRQKHFHRLFMITDNAQDAFDWVA